MSTQFTDPTITSDDKLWALLAYLLSPIIPIIILLMEDKKSRPYLKLHSMQALILGVLNIGIATLLGWLFIPLCLSLGITIAQIYYGIKAYQGEAFTIPVITDLVRNQGWA